MHSLKRWIGCLCVCLAAAHVAAAQAPPQQGRPRAVQGGPGRKDDYPDREKPPEELARRGKIAYGVNCAFCHGSDAAGGEVGPNLRRSSVVLEDQRGEKILPIVHGGRVAQGMPRIDISDEQVADIAAFLHSLPVLVQNEEASAPINVLTGDATMGKQTFDNICASCHSVDGDLKGFGGKIKDPRALQQTWLLPGGGRPSPDVLAAVHVPQPTVTVTLPGGQKVEGALIRIDDFYVGLRTADGKVQGFERIGEKPKVDLHDPLAPHRSLFHVYTDKQIHDITAYLVTLK